MPIRKEAHPEPWLEGVWEAFWTLLDLGRTQGMSPGPFRIEAILAYLDEYGITSRGWRDLYIDLLRSMMHRWREHESKRLPSRGKDKSPDGSDEKPTLGAE